MHRRSRNRLMGPVGRVPSNFGERGVQVYWVLSNFCSWLSFFLRAMWEADQTSLLNLRAEGKGIGDGEGTEEEKEGD